nr:uncharacterized protein LOC113724171 [Coffea arabica]
MASRAKNPIDISRSSMWYALASDRSIIDAASGGALANKIPKEVWPLIEVMAENSQQFGFCESNPTHRVNVVEMSSIQQQLSELTSFVRQLTMENVHQAKVCGICTNAGYPTDSCPMLQEDVAEQVNMVGGVPAPHRQYDPYSNTYNPGWKDYPNFSYGNRPQNSFSNRPPGFQQPWQPRPQPLSSNLGSSLEDIVKSLVTSTAQFQQETRSGMKNLETQISHMATTINRMESHVFEKLPSQPEANQKNVSAMTLRNDKEVEGSKLTNSKSKSEEKIEKGIEEEERIREKVKVGKDKEAEKKKEILDVFRKVQVNIPLLDAIKQTKVYRACPRLIGVRQVHCASGGLSVSRRAHALEGNLLDIIETRWSEDYNLQGVPTSSNLGDSENQT